MRKGISLFYTVLLLFAVTGCQDSSGPVSYTEPVPQKMMRMVPEHDHDESVHEHEAEKQLTWDLPESWSETRSSGIAMARITPSEKSDVSITITRLRGTAGGIAANIRRWGGQVGIPQMSDADLSAVQSDLPHDEAEAVLVDFNALPSVTENSMKVCILKYAGFSLFIKATGSKKGLATISDDIKKFVQSISYK